MAATGQARDWTTAELELIVADYFAMLGDELAGRTYSKTLHRRALMTLIDRNDGSIEFKHQNISAVLQELGLPWINGYKPRSNYQDALIGAIEHYLTEGTEALERARITPPAVDTETVFVGPPISIASERAEPALQRIIRRFDPAGRDARNRNLGKAGEAFVLDVERRRLARAGCGQLADQVRWVAQVDGDGAGYDIRSFDVTGADRMLEVKTTCGSERTPFYITRNELSLSQQRPQEFRLVRVHQFANDPRIFVLKPPLADHVALEPINFQARWDR